MRNGYYTRILILVAGSCYTLQYQASISFTVSIFIYFPIGWNGFIYVLKGKGLFGGPDKWLESDAHHTLVLGPGDHLEAKNEVKSAVIKLSHYNI